MDADEPRQFLTREAPGPRRRPSAERIHSALEDPRKLEIARYAVEHGGQWTVGELQARHRQIAPLRELHSLCMQLTVAGLLIYVPTVASQLRDQPFRVRRGVAAAVLAYS